MAITYPTDWYDLLLIGYAICAVAFGGYVTYLTIEKYYEERRQ